MIYSCRSYYRSLQRIGVTTDSRRFLEQIFKILIKSPKDETLWRMPSLKLASTKTDSRRFLERIFRNLIKSPKDEILWRTPSLKLANNVVQSSYLFRFSYSILTGLFIVTSLPLTKGVYRIFEIYRPLIFVNGLENRWAVTIGDLKVLNQDKNYWVLSKLDLGALSKSESNSAEEIIAALLLLWEGNLESQRLTVVFYRCLKFPKDSQWFETQSFLINALVNVPGNKFPSPKSFLI